jgi:hypothetical protein
MTALNLLHTLQMYKESCSLYQGQKDLEMFF